MSARSKISATLGMSVAAWAITSAALAQAPTPAPTAAPSAENVVLRLKGGTFQVEGRLDSFDGSTYVITASRIGRLSLDASRFDCLGAGCGRQAPVRSPVAAAVSPTVPVAASVAPTSGEQATAAATVAGVTIAVAPSTGAVLLPELVKGWAGSIGGSAVREIGATGGEARLLIHDRVGRDAGRFSVLQQDADAAIAALRSGAIDIAVTDRRITDAEAAALAPIAGDIRTSAHEAVIGWDAFAVVVSSASSLVSMTAEQMARVFSGQVKDWSQLGLPPAPIKVYASDTTTGPGSLFDTLVMKPRALRLAPAAETLPSSAAVAETIVEQAAGIGVVAYADLGTAKPVNIEQSCGLITRSNAFSIKTEEYPLSRRLYLYTAAPAPNPAKRDAMRQVLAFIASPAGQAIVADNQFVDQTLDGLAYDEHSGRLAFALSNATAASDATIRRLMSDIGDARRLTTTIRFDSSTSVIDSKSQADLVSFIRFMRTPEMRSKTVMLLGFSDAVGTAPKNVTLAEKRAAQVRSALLAVADGQFAPDHLVARGYGAIAPVACDNTAAGRSLNRRVEVWLRDTPAPDAAPVARRAGR